MRDDVILNKMETIKRCISRIHEEYDGFESDFPTNFTKQDSVVLNLERLSQATIDISAHIVRLKKLGIPQTSRELFVLMEKEGFLSSQVCQRMQSMVGFRNIAVHDYQNLNLDIVVDIVTHRLVDFKNFMDEILEIR